MSEIINLEQIADIYDVNGTNVQNNIRGGDFYINDGTNSAGVATGNVVFFGESIYPSTTMISNFPLVPNIPTPVPLTQVKTNTQWLAGYYNNFKVLILPSVTTFNIVPSIPSANISVNISGFDRYNNLTTCNNLAKPKGFSKLSSMTLTNLGNDPVNVTISTAVCFEFPYYNFGKNRYLLIPKLTNSDTSTYVMFQATNPVSGVPAFPTDYIEWAGTVYNPTSDPFNPEDFTTRPLILITNDELLNVVNNSTRTLISGRQIVFGTGNNLPGFVTEAQIPKYLNSQEVVYGGIPSASRWTGWQG
jgi:hypothetical protein